MHYDNWKTHIEQVPKLRTYCIFKNVYQVEPYVIKNTATKY